MSYCWANTAFCLVQLSEWERAMTLLHVTMKARASEGQSVDPLDTPGVAEWLDARSAIEATSPSAADILDEAIARCPDPSLVNP